MTSYHRCPKCNSDHMVDGAYVGGAQDARIVIGVDRHPDHGRLRQNMSTRIHASVCGSCGYAELYANQPGELYEAYSRGAGVRVGGDVAQV